MPQLLPKTPRKQIVEALWPAEMSSRVSCWAILDGARDDRIFGAVDRTSQDKCCLYAGDLPWQLQMAAPYLVQLDKDDKFTNYLIDAGWGNSWGVFFRSETSLRNLRHHLRGFLRVRDESGKRLLFRYYDPRVLRIYLPTCDQKELTAIFGPIQEFVMEDEDPGVVIEFGFDGRALTNTKAELMATR